MGTEPYVVSIKDDLIHREQLEQIWSQNLDTNFDDRYEWLYADNSFGASKTWVLHKHNDQNVIGCASIFPRHFFINKEKYHGGINCDLFIGKSHRTVGPVLQLLRTVVDSYNTYGFDFLIAFPNKRAKPIFRRCGYETLGSFTRWIKPLRSGNYFKAKYKGGNELLLQPMELAVDLFLHLRDMYTARKLAKGHHFMLQKKALDSFPDFSMQNNSTLKIGIRNSKYLAWRYTDNNSTRFESALFLEGGNPIGYLVYSLHDNIFTIVDLYLPDLKIKLPTAFSSITNKARSLGAKAISMGLMEESSFSDIMKELHFIERDTRTVCICCENNKIKQELLAQSNWYLLEGDVDF